jgi:radical SAM protein with 4Fe4S-binding SPASM domain
MTKKIPLFERLQIESQAFCNRDCWFCPRTYDRSGNYLDSGGNPVVHRMPTDTILDLLDQAQALGFRGRIGFHHYSEPLLDPRNIMLATEAAKRGMKPYLHTNGDRLRRDSGLCEKVSRVYGLIVVGIYDYETNEELDSEKRFWHDRLPNANLEFSPIGRKGARGAFSLGIPKALVPSDPRMAAPDLTYAHAPCHRPLIRMIIRHTGEMSNCCEDTLGAFKLGSIHERSLEELWFSGRHPKVIQDLSEGRRQDYSLCRNCPLPPSSRPLNGCRIEIARRHFSIAEACGGNRGGVTQ